VLNKKTDFFVMFAEKVQPEAFYANRCTAFHSHYLKNRQVFRKK